MPVQPTYPGVYIEEVSSGVHTITGVATSVTAFIGRAQRGPTDEPVTIFNYGEYDRIYGGLWNLSTMSFAVRDFFLNGGGQAVIVRVDKGSGTSKIDLPSEGSPPNVLSLIAANPGSWGNNLSVSIDWETKDKTDPALFNITILEISDNVIKVREKFLNVSTNSSKGGYLPRVLDQGSNLVRVAKDNNDKYIFNGRPSVTLSSPPASPPAISSASFSPVSEGLNITKAEIISGLNALEKTDIFNLLCIPPYLGDDNERPTNIDADVLTNAVSYCKKRRAMLIIDSQSAWTDKKKAIDDFKNDVYPNISADKDYAALFFPRIKQANILVKNEIEEFVPCGMIAGVFARTDAERGVWKAPAGIDAGVSGVNKFTVPLTDDENGELNQLGINCLRAFPVYGRVVWGARTVDGADQIASEWKYIPVRRTALFIEESLFRGTKWVVFEPNDEPLWAQIRLNIGAFMHNLFRQGAFQGKTPKEAYFVKCDKETTTQNDINSGIVNILVGFAPLKPAEFVMIKIQQIAGQIES